VREDDDKNDSTQVPMPVDCSGKGLGPSAAWEREGRKEAKQFDY
jgi:hypothetical protein